jgi:hypothetical protein
MITTLSFRAQALDPSVLPHLCRYGHMVDVADAQARADAVEEIAKITRDGLVTYDGEGVQITEYKNSLLIKIYANERDGSGRMAPIICWGSFKAEGIEKFFSDAESGFREFAGQVGLSVQDDQGALLVLGRDKLKRRIGKKKVLIMACAVLLASSLGALAISHFS